MQPEGGQCSSFSLVCMLLGACLGSGSFYLVTFLSCRVDVDLDIPAIAAIGWQSAGKSSLIEAISGITLPRASGTCTR
jgi:dynamin family protein